MSSVSFNIPNLAFYKPDTQAFVIIVITIGVFYLINTMGITDPEKRYNNIITLSVGGIIGLIISIIVSYNTIEPDTLDTSGFTDASPPSE